MSARAARVREADVEAAVLAALGRAPGVLLLKNEVGVGYTGNVAHVLQTALAPWPMAMVAARAVLQRHHITWGLGVGSPDLVGVVDGRAMGLELKAPDGVVAPHQDAWHTAARRRGAFVSVVRSADEAAAAVARCRAGESQ